eukprot:4797904-Pyramimonas_sp.AAC.1
MSLQSDIVAFEFSFQSVLKVETLTTDVTLFRLVHEADLQASGATVELTRAPFPEATTAQVSVPKPGMMITKAASAERIPAAWSSCRFLFQ